MEEDEAWDPYPCYEFNNSLNQAADDGKCEHCRKWLTWDCEHIDEFMIEEEIDDEI